jgi:predicted phosphoribosyltransferase
MFSDRREAGMLLAEKLQKYKGTSALVLALPRGGVVCGYELAHALSLPLDIIVTRKIAHPAFPEYAVGAVDERGTNIIDEATSTPLNAAWIQKEILKQSEEAKRRTLLYRKGLPPLDLKGKTAIIVDDGIATGFTMRLAIKLVKDKHPRKIVVAIPVSPPEPLSMLKAEGADEIIALLKPEEFCGAVGGHYREFEQVTDGVVVQLLHT